MKKGWIAVMTVVLLLALGTTSVWAAGRWSSGRGICNNQGAGYAYVDADGDGVCDNYGSGALRPQDGTGLHRGHCGGRGC